MSQFLLDSLSGEVNLQDLDGKARLAALAKPLLAQLPDGVYRELLTTELARRVGLPRERLDGLLGTPGSNTAKMTRPVAGSATGATPERLTGRGLAKASPFGSARGSLSRQAIALLLHYPAVAREVPLPPTWPRLNNRDWPCSESFTPWLAVDPTSPPLCFWSAFETGLNKPPWPGY